MDLSALTEHLDAVAGEYSLELPFGDRVYMVREPGVTRGVRLAAWLAVRSQDPAERDRLRAEALGGQRLTTVALGPEVVEQMGTDDVPGSVVYTLAVVATFAFVQGPEAADRYVARLAERRSGNGGDDVPGEATPRPQPSKSGRGTGSAKRTRTASSRATTSRTA